MELSELLERVPGVEESRRRGDLAEELPAFADRLQTTRPMNVLAIVALPPRRPISRRQWLHFIAISKGFRSEFAVIHLLAKHLAPTVLQTGIVPVIDPVDERELELTALDATVVRAMVERGTLLYELS